MIPISSAAAISASSDICLLASSSVGSTELAESVDRAGEGMLVCVSKGGDEVDLGTRLGDPKFSSELTEAASPSVVFWGVGAGSTRITLKVAKTGVPAYGCCFVIP